MVLRSESKIPTTLSSDPDLDKTEQSSKDKLFFDDLFEKFWRKRKVERVYTAGDYFKIYSFLKELSAILKLASIEPPN